MKINFLAIDGFNLVRRIYEARHPQTSDDLPAVLDAVVASCRRAMDVHAPTHAAMVFELHDRTWRHLLYPDYKSKRKPPPELLLTAIPKTEKVLQEKLGLVSCAVPNYEADDVIATIATVVASHEGQVVILSTDKAYWQLLGGGIIVRDHFKEQTWRVQDAEASLDIRLEQMLDYFALVGHKSNDVAGVPGIGPKSAVELLASYGTLDAILGADPDSGRLVSKVQRHAADAHRSRQLVALKTDVELGRNLRSFRLHT